MHRSTQKWIAKSIASHRFATVRLANTTVHVTDLRAHPERYTGLFLRARAEVKHADCLCRPGKNLRLVIRCRADRFHLANWPGQGHLHDTDCTWYRPDPESSGRVHYADDAIVATDEGVSIRLNTPLLTRTATPRSPAKPHHSETGTPTASRHSLGMLALLHYLWDEARLSVWSGRTSRPTWDTCHAQLVDAASTCTVNQMTLDSALYVVPRYSPENRDTLSDAWEAFTSRLGGPPSAQRRGLVLGEIRAIAPTQFAVGLKLRHLRGQMYLREDLLSRVKRSYRAALSASLEERGTRRVVLCVVSLSPRGYVNVDDMAAMLTTTTWIPADSSHEVTMADALVAAGRKFTKPLRYDGTGVFPDFQLTDTDPATFVEVWGIQGREDYENRKRQKRLSYKQSGRGLLEWDVRDPIPDVRFHNGLSI